MVRSAWGPEINDPKPPLASPEVCVKRCWIVIGVSARHESMRRRILAIHLERTDVLVGRLLKYGHLHVRELGNVFLHRIARTDQPLFDHHHGRDAEHRLGRRHHDEDRVLRHRLFRLDVHQPVGLEVHDLAAPCHRRHRALDVAGIDVPLHRRIDPLQSLGRHANGLRVGGRDLGTVNRNRREGGEGR